MGPSLQGRQALTSRPSSCGSAELALRWTQDDLAEVSGVSRVTIANLEICATKDSRRATLAGSRGRWRSRMTWRCRRQGVRPPIRLRARRRQDARATVSGCPVPGPRPTRCARSTDQETGTQVENLG